MSTEVGDSEEIGPVYSPDGKLLGTMDVILRTSAARFSWIVRDDRTASSPPGKPLSVAGRLASIFKDRGRWVFSGDPWYLAKHSRFTPTKEPQ